MDRSAQSTPDFIGQNQQSVDGIGLARTWDWWARQDSNLEPDGYEPSALTIELRARAVFSYQMFGGGTASTTILWQAFCRREIRPVLGCAARRPALLVQLIIGLAGRHSVGRIPYSTEKTLKATA